MMLRLLGAMITAGLLARLSLLGPDDWRFFEVTILSGLCSLGVAILFSIPQLP
jgi:hypothetical protein